MGGNAEHAYRALHLDVAAHEAEAWSDALVAAGAMSVDGSDSGAGAGKETQLFEEGAGESRNWWPVSRLAALFGPEVDPELAIASAAAALGCAVPAHSIDGVADRDWITAARDQFVPLEMAPGLWIVPSWCAPVVPEAINIRLDPGLAFGTGSHPTTQMCVSWLARTVRAGDSVLDYGCGSGILAIAAAKLGATRVHGVDLDAQAVRASRDNARINGVEASFAEVAAVPAGAGPLDERRGGTLGAPPARTTRAPGYDIVIANILARPLALLAPALEACSCPGGRVALAGILDAQADGVIAAYASWFTIRREGSRDGWVLLAGVHDRPAS